jgi:hypothetical protein
MMLLFNLTLLVLSCVQKLFACRAARLERKFARLAHEVNSLARDRVFKEGNSTRFDPFQAAKRQYLLGALVQKQDRLEAKYDTWALRAEKLERLAARLRQWKGRLVPYVVGAFDTVGLGCLIDYVTLGDIVRLRQLLGMVKSWFTV